jgi:predicted DNA-binding protein
MEYSQTNVRLSHDTISKLKTLAALHGLTYSSMCEEILEDGVLKLADEGYTLLSGDGLRAKIDIANSRLRRISNKEKIHVEYHQYP